MTLRPVAALALMASPALAEVPTVVADIGPVHSIVARVMDGLGEPVLLVPTGASPHGHALRPSEADALSRADLVVWVGEALAPWMGRAVGSLAGDATSLELLDAAGLAYDDAAAEEGGHDDHGHDEHGHDHGGIDPHGWLDPVTGKLWMDHVAAALSDLDPENAIVYAANAEAGKAELDSVTAEIETMLQPVRSRGYITFHDAYAAFETRFDMPSLGSISVSDAVPPSAGQVADLRAVVTDAEAVCVFSEPQFDPGLVGTLTEGTEAGTGVLDPLGAALEPGATLYPALLRNLAVAMETCLSQ